MPSTSIYELEKSMGKLLGSQREFIFAPEKLSCIAGGFGSGKTRAGCLKGLVLSTVFPGNCGMVLCMHGTDLMDRVMPVFMEVCPPSWIQSYNKQARVVTLKNQSQVMFRHLHDPNARGGAKTRRVGANLGWFFVDQMEEVDIEHFNAMISRLRLTKVPKHFGFGAINPNGHDWNFKLFFPQFRKWEDIPTPVDGKKLLYQVCRPGNSVLGVAVNSEENRRSNGGFVDDDYFDTLIRQYDAQWADRYIYCSFDDFTGKIYKSYVAALDAPEWASVHNIEPFSIPSNWELVVGIDVGGDSPWAIVPAYVDEFGNIIIVDGLTKPSMNTAEIAAWIKTHLPWNSPRVTYVIDWENKLAMLELAEYGIHCRPAVKHIRTGLLRAGTFFSLRKGYPLPPWYRQTQPEERVKKFEMHGSPKIYIFNTFTVCRQEHDEYVWNPNKPNEPLKTGTKRFDTCDAVRYILMSRPVATKSQAEAEKLAIYEAAREKDPLTVRAWMEYDKRVKDRIEKSRGLGNLHDAYRDDGDPVFEKQRFEFEA